MLPRKRWKVEKIGPHVEVWDWRSVLSDVARSSRLPELPDSDYCDRFHRIGRTCVLDLYCREMDSCVQPLGGHLFRIVEWKKNCLIRSWIGSIVNVCVVAREMEIPRAGLSMRGMRMFVSGETRSVCAE